MQEALLQAQNLRDENFEAGLMEVEIEQEAVIPAEAPEPELVHNNKKPSLEPNTETLLLSSRTLVHKEPLLSESVEGVTADIAVSKDEVMRELVALYLQEESSIGQGLDVVEKKLQSQLTPALIHEHNPTEGEKKEAVEEKAPQFIESVAPVIQSTVEKENVVRLKKAEAASHIDERNALLAFEPSFKYKKEDVKVTEEEEFEDEDAYYDDS
ncbi:hypothetical protein AgCh_034055 [Apium graveolens]